MSNGWDLGGLYMLHKPKATGLSQVCAKAIHTHLVFNHSFTTHSFFQDTFYSKLDAMHSSSKV